MNTDHVKTLLVHNTLAAKKEAAQAKAMKKAKEQLFKANLQLEKRKKEEMDKYVAKMDKQFHADLNHEREMKDAKRKKQARAAREVLHKDDENRILDQQIHRLNHSKDKAAYMK